MSKPKYRDRPSVYLRRAHAQASPHLRKLAQEAVQRIHAHKRARALMTPEELAADDAAIHKAGVDFLMDTRFGGP